MLKNWRDKLRAGAIAAGLIGVSATVAPGCLNRPIEPVEPRTTTTIVERLTQSAVDKIDLLLVIDNSRSMADKQEILRLAVPDLAGQLINPSCINPDTGEPAPSQNQPQGPLEECPDGFQREFDPILDIHIGVITSSLGGHGSDNCTAASELSENDGGRLINRNPGGGTVPTYSDKGFLAWDPDTNNPGHNPQGETDQALLIENLGNLVAGAGEVGCGFEATLEAWYRFLADPNPYETIEIEGGRAVLKGTDNALLTQRRDFLRPDSLLAVIMLSDENDCSIRDGSNFYFAAQTYNPNNPAQLYRLPKARSECATDPNDECCLSCGQPQGNCPADPACDADMNGAPDALAAADDDINLRCYDQKRRFGIDFLYPISRYTNALSQGEIQDRNGNVEPNPLFDDLNPDDDNSAVRDTGLVFVAGIVGVPWQDIARVDENGNPNLITGQDSQGNPVGGFQSAAELAANGTWGRILGDPTCYATDASCLPGDPLMIESTAVRSGTQPVTGDPVTDSGSPLGNSVNGHDYGIPGKDDLQYACIFQLPTEVDCSMAGATESCDCKAGDTEDNPLCYDGAAFTQTQFRAKAYPGIRELQLLQSVGNQGIVGSICPEQLTDTGLINFGYRPAVGTIIERLKQALGGQCLPRSLTPDVEGNVPCVIIEARRIPDAGACEATCNVAGRSFIDQSAPAVQAAKQDELAETAGWNCFCQIDQLQGGNRDACQNDASDAPVNGDGEAVNGWCYVDAATVPRTGNPEIVADCPATEQRIIRFVGEGQGASGATLFITCSGE